MILERMSDFITSPVIVKLIVVFFLYAYYNYIQSKQPILQNKLFRYVIILFAVRDLLFYFYPVKALYFISDVIMLNGYILWLGHYRDTKRQNIPLYIFSAVYIAAVILNLLLGEIIQFNIVLQLLLFGFIAFLGTQLYSISPYNSENAEIVLISRQILIGIPITFNVITILFGYSATFIQVFIVPLSYIMHFVFLYNYQMLHDSDTNNQLDYLSNYLDSLFDFMKNIGTAIAERIEMSQVLDYIVSSAVKNSNADAGAILLIDEFEDILTVKAVHGFFPPPYAVPKIVKSKLSGVQDYFQSTPLKLGQTILGEAAKTGEPIFIRNTINDERTKFNIEDDTCFMSSIIVIPLVVSKKILGVLAVLRRQKNKLFEDIDFDHVKTFADYASLTMDNLFTYMQLLEKQEIEREVGIAAEIQQKLLPRKIPHFKNVGISAYSVPAKGVSGDYYDIIPIKREGKIALVICDVAGKGVPASLVMVMIRTIVHLIAGAHRDASKIVNWINKGIAGKIDIERFATLSFLSFDTNTHMLEYSNAAHHPLMIYRSASGEIDSLDTEGLPIGLEPGTKYGLQTTMLLQGDVIVLYTDGIIEAMNTRGQQYSYESLAKVIQENHHLDPDSLAEIVRTDVENFVGYARQHDDQTLLLMKVL